MTNRAIIINAYGGADTAQLSSIAMPEAAPGVALVRVRAAGINGLDWKIREGYMRDAMPIALPAALGLELAGEVFATVPGNRFAVGDRVMGLTAGIGAYADYVAVPESLLVPTPDALTDTTAAALPVAGLTAWQMLHAAGEPRPGQTVLVHGAAGGVGTLLVQMAKHAGLTVLATASAASRSHLEDLDVDRIIDRVAERFEDIVSEVDLVIDLAGVDAPDRSWLVLRAGGMLVSSVRPEIAAPRTDGRRGVWFSMRPDGDQLTRIAEAAASGALAVTMSEIVPMADLPMAIERNRAGHAPGKAVADFTLP